jgi:hypothetical protein
MVGSISTHFRRYMSIVFITMISILIITTTPIINVNFVGNFIIRNFWKVYLKSTFTTSKMMSLKVCTLLTTNKTQADPKKMTQQLCHNLEIYWHSCLCCPFLIFFLIICSWVLCSWVLWVCWVCLGQWAWLFLGVSFF